MNNGEYCSPINSKHFLNNIDQILCPITFVKKGKKEQLGNVASVFDIEATSFYYNGEKKCCMYAWVFGLNGRCIRGRTWDEFFEVINTLNRYYNLNTEKRLVIYIQNLSYEFQWFRKYFQWEKVFCVDDRKPVYAITKNGIEFRCSYILSGYSLEVMGENLTKYKVKKMVGDLDYKLARHSRTPLNEKEWGYILNDGVVVMAYIQEEIERLGSIAYIPLTKTGYVRNLCREKCLKGDDRWQYSKLMKYSTLTPKTYRQSKRAYTGGFTHANVNYVGQVLKDVHSYDFCSSYPAVMVSEKYPMGAPKIVCPKNEQDFKDYINGYCCMFDCKFNEIYAKVDYENYISVSRCTDIEHYILNNGRVIEAETLTITLTEQDFFTISELYSWDTIEVSNFHIFYADYLPRDLVLTILELYKSKTELKDVEEKIVEYMVSKGMVNSCYGMAVTDPCRDEIVYSDDIWKTEKSNIEEQIEKYNSDRNRFLYYPWGIWVTAYARRNLFSGINEFRNDYIYSDTDSVKVLNAEKHYAYIENYNKRVTSKIKACLDHYNIPLEMAFPKTVKGKVKPLGVWEYEGKYDRFKTLGAKRYMVEKDGEISITIAGVGKKAGIKYLRHTYKTNDAIFEAFEEDLVFPAHYDYNGDDENGSGKLLHTYIDTEMMGYIVDYLGNKSEYHELSGVHMENTEYSLSLAEDFKNLLTGIRGSHIS